MIVKMSNNASEIDNLINQGFCPVECSVGGNSYVDELQMDHHGTLSGLESVAIRAYRDHFGARRDDPRFVVAGVMDADAAFCIASLAGRLPHPDADVAGLPPHLHAGAQKDLSSLAELVALIDTDPIGRDIAAQEGGDVLLAWNALTLGSGRDDATALMAVVLWGQLVSGHPARKPLLVAALQTEADRREAAAAVPVSGVGDWVGIVVDSPVFGFDVWYGRDTAFPADALDGWDFPVVLALARGAVTIGCPNKEVSEDIFGEGGLKNVFALLGAATSAGWGGRESIGGSPRGLPMTENDLRAAAVALRVHLEANPPA